MKKKTWEDFLVKNNFVEEENCDPSKPHEEEPSENPWKNPRTCGPKTKENEEDEEVVVTIVFKIGRTGSELAESTEPDPRPN